MKTCYACNQPATTVEHVPPKCLFPKKEDTGGEIDYRRNLITVPSCDLHNSEKKLDDEYLMHVLSASITSNSVGINQFLNKSVRALEARPSLLRMFRQSALGATSKLNSMGDAEFLYPLVAEVDRFERAISSCVRALYFHETGNKSLGAIGVLAPFLSYGDKDADHLLRSALIRTEALFSAKPKLGENKDVFYYKFEMVEQSAVFLLCFYGGTKFIARLSLV